MLKRAEAAAYCDWASRIPGMVEINHSCGGVRDYLYIEKLVGEKDEQKWMAVSEARSEESLGIWEQRAKEGKAMRNYAAAKGVHVSKVTLDMVQKDQNGVDGWCDVTITLPIAPKNVPKPDGGRGGKQQTPMRTPKKTTKKNGSTAGSDDGLDAVSAGEAPRTPGAPADGDVVKPPKQRSAAQAVNAVISKTEKEAKEVLAKGTQAIQRATVVAAEENARPWMAAYCKQLTEATKAVEATKQQIGSFATEFAIAALTPEYLKALKNKYTDQYLGMLQSYVRELTSPTKTLLAIVQRIENMLKADAEHASPQPQKKKPRKSAS